MKSARQKIVLNENRFLSDNLKLYTRHRQTFRNDFINSKHETTITDSQPTNPLNYCETFELLNYDKYDDDKTSIFIRRGGENYVICNRRPRTSTCTRSKT